MCIIHFYKPKEGQNFKGIGNPGITLHDTINCLSLIHILVPVRIHAIAIGWDAAHVNAAARHIHGDRAHAFYRGFAFRLGE